MFLTVKYCDEYHHFAVISRGFKFYNVYLNGRFFLKDTPKIITLYQLCKKQLKSWHEDAKCEHWVSVFSNPFLSSVTYQ